MKKNGKNQPIVMASCIACRKKVYLGECPRLGMMVVCQKCGTKLELIRVKPPMLDWPLVEIDLYNETFDEDAEFATQ